MEAFWQGLPWQGDTTKAGEEVEEVEDPYWWQRFNDFVTITDTQKYQTYLAETSDEKVYRLSANRTFAIWDQIFLSANVKPLDLSQIFVQARISPFSWAFWDYQFNYDKWIFMKGIDGTMYEKSSFLVDPDNPWTMNGITPEISKLWVIDRTRAGLQRYVSEMYGQNKYAGLLLWLLIGDKSFIPTEAYDTFVDSGLVHIIAVSGGNIAMVVILLSFLLKRVPLYVRNGLIILMIIAYATICGADSSVIRAAIMGSLTLIALFRGREISIRRSMKYASILILLLNPFALVYDVGFLLSFAAIIGIVLVQKWSEKLTEKTREDELKQVLKMKHKDPRKKTLGEDKKNWIATLRLRLPVVNTGHSARNDKSFFESSFWKEYMIPTIWASLGTAPILMFFMNGVNLIGILLNIIIVPIIPVVTIYGFASLILYWLIAWNGWTWIEVLIMKCIYRLSEVWANYAIFVQAKNLVAKYVIMVLFVILWGIAYWELHKPTQKKKRES